jgi:hypothetical protein
MVEWERAAATGQTALDGRSPMPSPATSMPRRSRSPARRSGSRSGCSQAFGGKGRRGLNDRASPHPRLVVDDADGLAVDRADSPSAIASINRERLTEDAESEWANVDTTHLGGDIRGDVQVNCIFNRDIPDLDVDESISDLWLRRCRRYDAHCEHGRCTE